MHHDNIFIVFQGISKKIALAIIACGMLVPLETLAITSIVTTSDSSNVQLQSPVPQTRQTVTYNTFVSDFFQFGYWNVQCAPGEVSVGTQQQTYPDSFTYTSSHSSNGWSWLSGNYSTAGFVDYPAMNGIQCYGMNQALNWRTAP